VTKEATETAVSGDLAQRTELALGDAFLRRAVRFTVERLRNAKAASTEAAGDWEERRERGRQLREHVIENLDQYLERFSDNLEARGHHVHFAADAAEAQALVLGIVQRADARLIAKSKSMVSEEVEINHHLGAHGIECLETDLGEWIVQLAHETPSHIIIPAIHKNRKQVQRLFEDEGGTKLTDETRVLAAHARRRLRERFAEADVGMTGCNFAIAESGSVVIFTNEGNGRMVTTLPRVHIVMMGMERIIPSLRDLPLMASLLPRSATGQKLTTYVNIVTGARRPGELDGARELHVVVLDNGRSRQLGDAKFQSILHCIRCGACLNVCPVYRQVGGHAYASVYSGPIGAVITPLLAKDDPRAAELANASSLCGACHEACPVKIPLHDMLVELRKRNTATKPGNDPERVGFRLFAAVASRPWLYRLLTRLGRALARGLGARGERWLGRFGPGAGWARHRALPVIQDASFRDAWKTLEAEKR
jgi:L-lactate dehydrogenase complex protein LldF